jgi:CheY-specific phosphatase CheX
MSSPKLPMLVDPEVAGAMLAAVRSVAEQSFFASAEPCDDHAFDKLSATVSRWLVATVMFEEGPFVGSMACTLSEDLAHALFDAFAGRDPSAAAPARDEVDDLVGEFSNMVCGAWLTVVASGQIFSLSHPIVKVASEPPGGHDKLRLRVAVNDLPLAVDVHLLKSMPQGDRSIAHV